MVSSAASRALANSLEIDPDNFRARYYAGLAAAQAGKLEKAKRRKRRTAVSQKSSAGHHHQEKLSNMNIMWRATSLESKAKGDLRRHGVHKNQQSTNGDHHEVFRNSTNYSGFEAKASLILAFWT